jgi:hypothetical protein
LVEKRRFVEKNDALLKKRRFVVIFSTKPEACSPGVLSPNHALVLKSLPLKGRDYCIFIRLGSRLFLIIIIEDCRHHWWPSVSILVARRRCAGGQTTAQNPGIRVGQIVINIYLNWLVMRILKIDSSNLAAPPLRYEGKYLISIFEMDFLIKLMGPLAEVLSIFLFFSTYL